MDQTSGKRNKLSPILIMITGVILIITKFIRKGDYDTFDYITFAIGIAAIIYGLIILIKK